MTAIKGTFLCVGANVAAGVVVLGEGSMREFYRTMGIIERRCSERRIESERALAFQRYFYAGVELAIPAWLQENMLSVVSNYTGPDKDRMRMLAAMIHEGKNYGVDVDGDGPSDEPKGGQPAKLTPVKPIKPPGGAKAKAKKEAAPSRA